MSSDSESAFSSFSPSVRHFIMSRQTIQFVRISDNFGSHLLQDGASIFFFELKKLFNLTVTRFIDDLVW